jgi:hypothetical protein
MIVFNCPHCGKSVNAPDQAAGKRAKCPGCLKSLAIPGSAASAFKPIENPEIVPDFEVIEDEPKPNAKLSTGIQRKPSRRDEEEEILEVEAVTAEEPRPKKRRRRDDDYDDEDDDDYYDRPRKRRKRRGPHDGTRIGRTGYAVCYNCGADAASRVSWTLWGGLIGPAMICHCRCDQCGTTFNGRTGKSNNTAVTVYIVVSVAISLAILGLVALGAN